MSLSRQLSNQSLPTVSEIGLIITDVDGTLLTSQHQLHPRTLHALSRVRKLQPDLPIVIASGKQYNSCHWIRNKLDLPSHFHAVHCNGAIIYGGNDGKALKMVGLEKEVVEYLMEKTMRWGTFVFTENEVLLVSRGEGINQKDWVEIAGRYDKGVSDRSSAERRAAVLRSIKSGEMTAVKVTICADESDLQESSLQLASISRDSPLPYTLTRAIPFIFEAVPASASKSAALSEICRMLEIGAEQVLAFGDGDNDVGMLGMAGYGVAMSNGMDSAIGAARYVTGSNDEGGVGMFLEKTWQLEDSSEII